MSGGSGVSIKRGHTLLRYTEGPPHTRGSTQTECAHIEYEHNSFSVASRLQSGVFREKRLNYGFTILKLN